MKQKISKIWRIGLIGSYRQLKQVKPEVRLYFQPEHAAIFASLSGII